MGLSALSGVDGQDRRVRLDEMLAETSGCMAERGTRPESAGFAWNVTDQFVARRMRSFTVGLSRLSEVFVENRPFFSGGLLSLDAEHERAAHGFGASRRAKAQAVLSEAWDVLGGGNFRLGVTWANVSETPFVLGASVLSGTDGSLRRERIDEMRAETAGCIAERGDRPDSVCGVAAGVCLRSENRFPREWRHEPWAHRHWWTRRAFVNLKQEGVTI